MDAKAAASTSSAIFPSTIAGNSNDEDLYDPALMDMDHNNRVASGGAFGDDEEEDDAEELDLNIEDTLDTSLEDSIAAGDSGGLGPTSVVMQASTSNTGSRSQNKPHVLLAVYSSIPVYEFMIRGIGVMRRRSDSWINATQLLKVAGIEKGKRTKILDKDIAAPDSGIQFEKVQGGYGRYQGTWIPFHEATKMAEQYGILELVRPLLEYQPASSQQAPLAGLSSSQSPNTSLTPLDQPQVSSTSAPQYPQPQQQISQGQGQIANPQQQRLQQQQQLQNAQSQPIPTLTMSRPQGIAAAAAAPPQASTSQMQTQLDNTPSSSRKRPRQPGSGPSSTSLNGVEAAESSVDASSATGNKRARTEPAANAGEGTASAAVAPTTRLRKASKHPEPSQPPDAAVLEEHRSALMSLFMSDPNSTSSSSLETDEIDPSTVISNFPTGLDPDLAIDGQQHTALHWACALGRLSTVQALIGLGADVNRGNEAGETPLMRAVLVTNNFDTETFAPPHLLSLLAGSLRTVDDAERTVLHHIALVAGIKGRSAAARHYMESILHYLAENEADSPIGGGAEDLIDAQDSNGDTALNIAARVGSRPMVRMLLESGADQKIPNKLGLRAGDFGLLEEGLTVPTPAELAVEQIQGGNANNKSTTSGTKSSASGSGISSEQRSSEFLTSISTILQSLSTDFTTELSSRTDSLNRTKVQLHSATKDLADQRQNLASLREKVRQVELSKWRIRNLEKALEDEDQFDWTGRTGLDGEPAFSGSRSKGNGIALNEDEDEDPSIDPSLSNNNAEASIRAAFEYRGPNSVLKAMPAVNMPMNIDADAPLPAAALPFAPSSPSTSSNTSQSSPSPPPPSQLTLVQLRRMIIWYERVISLLSGRIKAVKEGHGELELDARRLVKICTGVNATDDVEGILDGLITALESDGAAGGAAGGPSSGPDLQRVSKFMAKVRSAELPEPSPGAQ